MASIIDGKKLAENSRQNTAVEAQKLRAQGIVPGLAFLLVGAHPASQVYVKNKQKACDDVGIHNILKTFPADVAETTLLNTIAERNRDDWMLPTPSAFDMRPAKRQIAFRHTAIFGVWR